MERAEYWRTVPSYPLYQASSHGRVRRNPYQCPNARPDALRPACTNGYLWLTLKGPKGAPRKAYVHRLVCEAFYGEAPSPAHQVAHRDGIRDHNRPENLRWATIRENHADKKLHGTHQTGEKHGSALLNDEGVRAIRLLSKNGWGIQRISRALGRSFSCVEKVLSGKTWKHVT